MEAVINTILAALMAGAATGAQQITTDAISTAYAKLKDMITGVSSRQTTLSNLEKVPSDRNYQNALASELRSAPVDKLDLIAQQASKLLAAMESLQNEKAALALFDFEKLRAAGNFVLEDIEAVGTVLRVRDEAVFENFSAKHIRSSEHSKKKHRKT